MTHRGDGERDALDALIELGDLDELVRHVDRLCERRDWVELARLRDRCRAALARGKQLWPAASHAEYRLALEAPAQWAAQVLVPGTGYLALGPLAEVAASTHEWAELAPHASPGPVSSLAAHERALRGEAVDPATVALPEVVEVPLALQAWEPTWPVATYRAHEIDAPAPDLPATAPVELPPRRGGARRLAEDAACAALREVVRAWTTQSNGRVDVAVVEGSAADAIAELGPPEARVARSSPQLALATLGWAGASGGAHGRRRGAAMGRFDAWWTLAALAGLDWPCDPAGLGAAAAELRWFVWDAAEPLLGWRLQLAVEDPADGLAWAIAAADAA